MMTEMQTIEGGQKDVSSLEGSQIKKKCIFNVQLLFKVLWNVFSVLIDVMSIATFIIFYLPIYYYKAPSMTQKKVVT